MINVDGKQSDEQFGDEEREPLQEHKASDTENGDDALAMAKNRELKDSQHHKDKSDADSEITYTEKNIRSLVR